MLHNTSIVYPPFLLLLDNATNNIIELPFLGIIVIIYYVLRVLRTNTCTTFISTYCVPNEEGVRPASSFPLEAEATNTLVHSINK